MRRLRILLADDHETVREGLKAILNAQDDMQVVGEAVDGQTTVARACELLPDVIVMDVSMPRLNGLKATETLARYCPTAKVIALTRHADGAYLHELLQAGASGYVLKQSRAAELLQGIRAVVRGGTYLDPAIAGRAVADQRRKTSAASASVPDQILSPREEEVLRLAALGYTNKESAARLAISVKTIETHKANAMQKLGFHSRIDIVRFALLKGWLDEA